MSDDASAGASLLLAQHDTAHREQKHQHHQHQHQKLHKRTSDRVVVTEVVATVSVIQQIDVDSNGLTFSFEFVPAPTEDSSPVLTDSSQGPSISTTSTEPTVLSTSNPFDQSILSLSSGQSALTAPASTPSISSSFSSLIVRSNSTNLISGSSSLSNGFSNSTRSSSRTSLTSLTYITSSTPFVTSDRSKTTSTSSQYFTGSSTGSVSSDDGAFIAGGTAVTSGTTSSNTGASKGDSGSASEPATPTPVIVGSVVSSVAGAAVIILAILFFWRWRKRNRNMLALGSISGAAAGSSEAIRGGLPSQPSSGMTERRSFVNSVPAALASLTGYKRFSQKTERTISSTAGSERGFYRVSGRKLPSVLQSGGDGYGGGVDDIKTNTLSGTSFYRDSQGFYGGPGSPVFPPIQRDSGVPVMRPSPARTPVQEQGPFSSLPSPPLVPPLMPDALGRSRPSQDGSHPSRFKEEV